MYRLSWERHLAVMPCHPWLHMTLGCQQSAVVRCLIARIHQRQGNSRMPKAVISDCCRLDLVQCQRDATVKSQDINLETLVQHCHQSELCQRQRDLNP
mmetsp:Transcript_41904/g.105339  ORF Transcript_41904/g.105339 Transcript_41904/m.105339 type:complete len:98 (+) Transcript_41904:12-305(+)